MKRWEKIMGIAVIIVAAAGIIFGVSNQRRMATLSVSREVYEDVVGTPEPGSSEEIYDEYGQLTEEAIKKYDQKLQEGECDVLLKVGKIKSPRSIPKIKRVKWKTTYMKNPEESIRFYEKLVEDNAAGKLYSVLYDNNKNNTFIATMDTPYELSMGPTETGILKVFADTEGVKPWELNEEMAKDKTKKVVTAINEFYGVNLNDKNPEEWAMERMTIGTSGCAYRYENGVKEECYAIGVGQLVQGYPVLVDTQDHTNNEYNIEMELSLSETGWKMLSVHGERMYKADKGNFEGIITVKEAAENIKKVLELNTEIHGKRVYTATYAKLGYLDTTETEIRPIWKFIGKMDGKVFSTEGEIIVDAVSGSIISNSVGL